MSDRPLRIAIATNGRFHVLDLARELAALGQDVTFYSMLPPSRAARFGLDPRRCVSFFLPMLPFLIWDRLRPSFRPDLRDRWSTALLNRLIANALQPCDVFIGMSGLILEAAEVARNIHGATIFVERGSKHVDAQAEILAARGAPVPTEWTRTRERASYALADRIVIPADHVASSFARDPAAAAKTLANAYGVDLEEFPQHPRRREGPPTLIFVGGWLLRKGVDLLVAALDRLPEHRLIHVGGIPRGEGTEHPRITHVGTVDQRQLTEYYAQADVFVLPSREEGLALVQPQALASGLPIVCSDQTGGRDLRYTPALAERITEVPVENVDALVAAIAAVTANARDLPPLPEADRALLTWRAYGERYLAHIRAALADRAGR